MNRGNYEDRHTPETERKITCHKCNNLIQKGDHYCTFHGAHFHQDCYNDYEHYYGLDKPID